MPPDQGKSYPFLTRGMLAFDQGTVFDLEVQAIAGFAGDINITGMTREGPFSYTITLTGNSTVETTVLSLADVPIMLTLHTGSTFYDQGDLWTAVYLRAASTRVAKLFSGYVTLQNALSYPAVSGENPVGTRQLVYRELGTDPAAGVDAALTLAAGQQFVLRGISVTLVTDGTVANRRMHFQVKISSNVAFEFFPSIDQAASSTYTYYAGNFGHIPDELDNNVVMVNMPDNIVIGEGNVVQTAVANLQAGDNIGIIRLWAEEHRRPPQ